ncbi:M48 family metalloprotease, partial [Mycobacterium kansasii]
MESDPGLTKGPAAYRFSEHTIFLYKEYLSKYAKREQAGIIAHELGHAMGLEHGCRDTLMQGTNVP